MIRRGRIEDIDGIIEIGTKLLRGSNNRNVPVSRQSVFRALGAFIRAPDKAVLLAEHDEVITGFIMVAIETYWWADQRTGRRYATDWAFYSQRAGDGAKILKIIRDWAFSMPRVIEVNIVRNFVNAEHVADEVFKSAGYNRAGAMYTCQKPEESSDE